MTREQTQELIHVMKKLLLTGTYYFPTTGQMNSIPLQSLQSPKDKFTVYVNRKSTIVPGKYSTNLHYPQEDLLRIDVNGPVHVNPDGTKVPCPHIHIRTKDTGKWDVWAYDIPAGFGNTEDYINTVKDFLQYCHTNNIDELMICEQKELGDESAGT